MSLFERYLTLWVALCIVAGIALGHLAPGVFHAIGAAEIAKVNLPVAALIWLMIIPMLIKIDFAALARSRPALARHRRDPVHQLGGQAVLDGGARRVLHRLSVPPLSARRSDQLLHRRPDPARRRAVHGDGVRLVEPDARRAAFHPDPGRAERHDHGVRLRADRRPAARPLGDHRAVEHAGPLGRALHRRAGDRGAAAAPPRAGDRRAGGAGRACWRRCNPFRWSRCWRRWCCCSASRASRSSPSR